MQTTDNLLGRLGVTTKTGEEPFRSNGASLEYTLLDFWRWSVSDLVSNATRGRLAEFIVARALGICTEGIRDEWAAYDLVTPEGVRIEVKSAAYLQSWSQRRLSPIQFITRRTRAWDPETNILHQSAARHAHLYVFALLAHTDKRSVDPLNLDQWTFYVLRTALLDARTRSQHSITLKTLERLSGGPVDYHGLGTRVAEVSKA
jgi:hypothetical protein